MARADERNDGGGFHEIKMSACAAQQSPRAVTKRRGRAERDERVHVGTADFELPPRAAVKLRATKNLHDACERKRKPLKPPAHHQQTRDGDAEPQIELPVFVFGFVTGTRASLHLFCLIACFDDGFNDRRDFLLRAGIPAHRRALIFQRNGRAADAGHALNRFGDVTCAVAARHAVHMQLCGGGFGCLRR